MIRLEKFGKKIGGKTLYENINISIGKDIYAIVGPNGSGKTTFLNCISGLDKDYEGNITFDKDNYLIGYMHQQLSIEDIDITMLEYIKTKLGIFKLEKKLEKLYNDLAMIDSEEENVLKQIGDTQEKYENLEGYIIDNKILETIRKLGFKEDDINKKISHFSGGEKRKILLAIVFLKGIDLVLLDEPTNDLDIKTISTLIDFIKSNNATILVISHDINFINSISKKTIQVDSENNSINLYNLNYNEYKKFKDNELKKNLETYQNQQLEKKKLNKILQEKKNDNQKKVARKDNDKIIYDKKKENSQNENGKKINNIKQKIESLDLEKPNQKKALKFDLKIGDLAHGTITLKDIFYRYDKSNFNINIKTFEINSGERIFLLGNNGEGKSTIIKIITGQILPLNGNVKKNPSFKFGIFSQSHDHLLSNKNAFEYIKNNLNENILDDQILNGLARFGIKGKDCLKDINFLSPGQKARTLLALFNLNKYNCLILDEPTNHLDIEAIEELTDTLNEFQGTLIISSHDINFIKSIKNSKYYEIKNGKINPLYNIENYFNNLIF